MSYRRLIMQVAKEYNTTPAEVHKEIKAAIKAAGLDIEPSVFIASCANKIRKDYIS